jgi:hypothetical protein
MPKGLYKYLHDRRYWTQHLVSPHIVHLDGHRPRYGLSATGDRPSFHTAAVWEAGNDERHFKNSLTAGSPDSSE